MVKNTTLLILFLFILVFFSSCLTSKKVNYMQEPGGGIARYSQSDSIEEYKLQLGDRLSIMVSTTHKESRELFSGGMSANNMGYQSAEIVSYTIYPDSCIDYPYVGRVKVAGLSQREVGLLIRDELAGIVPDCDVSVRLVNSSFSVIGKSGNGKYDITKDKLTIYQALAMSGDLKGFSSRAKLHILRPTPNGTEVKTFDVRSKYIINSEYYYVRPNDVIYVQSFSGQFFGLETFSSVITTIASTLSFGYLIYTLIF